MLRRLSLCCLLPALWLPATHAVERPPVTLLRTPVEVTATFSDSDVGVYFAQISVHNGPIAQLVDTTLHADSPQLAEQQLQQQVVYRAPYLFVHTSCGGGTVWLCDRETAFKVSAGKLIRMGQLYNEASNTERVLRNGRFYDLYDKLEQRVDGLSHATSPSFTIVLTDVNDAFSVDADTTWTANQERWRKNAQTIAATLPDKNWLDAEWEPYFSALVTNAALARYCEHTDELQSLLKETEPMLDAVHRRALADALSKVTPLETPKNWRSTR